MKYTLKNIAVAILGVVSVAIYYFCTLNLIEHFSPIGIIGSLVFFMMFGFLRFRYSPDQYGEKEQELIFFIAGIFLAEGYYAVSKQISPFLCTMSTGFISGILLALFIPKHATEEQETEDVLE